MHFNLQTVGACKEFFFKKAPSAPYDPRFVFKAGNKSRFCYNPKVGGVDKYFNVEGTQGPCGGGQCCPWIFDVGFIYEALNKGDVESLLAKK